MGSINRVTIMGNVGRDPEIRSTQDGRRLANLSIATSETWRDRNSGERREKTEWHRVTVWPEKAVEIVEKYVRKGDMILIEGQLETRKWQDQQGNDRYSTEIVVQAFKGGITLIGRIERSNGNGSGRLAEREAGDDGYGGGGYGGGNGGGARPRGRNDDLDDEIPF